MVQHEQKTLDDIVSPQQITRTTRTLKGFANKHFLIGRIRRHLVTQFSAAKGNK
jgi:hypothetical protein